MKFVCSVGGYVYEGNEAPEKCPQCGGVYVVNFDCRTFEESKFCQRCGKAEEIARFI